MGGSQTLMTRHAVAATKVGTDIYTYIYIYHRAPVSMVDQLFLYSDILSLSETTSPGRFPSPSDASLGRVNGALVGAESLGDLVETSLG